MHITTHVLDTSRGTPAADVSITLDRLTAPEKWQTVSTTSTNSDGRTPNLIPKHHALSAGTYRLTFHTAHYFASLNTEAFYPEVQIQFIVKDPTQHYHVPLLLSPFGYATYRGS